MNHLSINAPLDKSVILKLPAACRTTISRNLLGLFEGRLVYYEPIPTVTKHICRKYITSSHNLQSNTYGGR